MSNAWFRLYSEFATDPKVQMLSESDQRRFIMLLCMRCSNGDVTLHDEEVAFQLRIGNDDWAQTKRTLIDKGLIDEGNKPAAWNKRQFVSDLSAARVAKHRAKVSRQAKQPCNVTVTPPDTDTDTDTEVNTPPIPPAKREVAAAPAGFTEFWETWPSCQRKQAKGKCLSAWKRAKAEPVAAAIVEHVRSLADSEDWQRENGRFIPAPLVYLNQRRWEGAEPARLNGSNSAVGGFV